ncbi:unnamed protein product [Lactuca virosa]|uniref:Uncharacterized protein n=1 Tax=Lactuca virosa TaxID=75947 RepID=A0AAU9N2K8_9ASTR|nr:unnamed protein product [Lactuca virosa]
MTGVIGKCLGHKIGSLDQLNLIELRILYAIVRHKDLDFAQLFFDHLVECISGNNRPTYLSYPRWIALLFAHAGMGYDINHKASILTPTLSSKIIKVGSTEGDIHLFQRMLLWIEHPYTIDDEDEDE